MVLDQVFNWVKVTVSTGYDAAATSIILITGDGSKLPDPAVTNYNLVWWDSTQYLDPQEDPNHEIVRVTGKSTDTITVTRATTGEGTNPATTKNTSGHVYKMILSFTKLTYDAIKTVVEATTGTNTGDNTIATAEVVTDTASATTWPALYEAATGSIAIHTDAGLTYNASTANLATTTFTGALTGAASLNVLKAGDTISGNLIVQGIIYGIVNSMYGISWDESADTYVRTGSLVGVAVGASPGNALLPIQSAMRRCVINNSGVVQYYLDPSDSTLKIGGGAAVLTGADGQVMVEIPAFYYRYAYAGTTHTWEISQVPLSGFSLHPAFIKNNTFVPYRYIGAYESTLYDVSASIYTNGIYQTAVSCVFALVDSSLTIASRTGVFSKLTVGDKIVVSGTAANNGTKTVASLVSATKITIAEAVTDGTDAATVIQTEKDFTATTGDVLASISGKAPINYGTRAQFRAVALNRGTGWRQQDYDLISAIQLLYLVEFASFYSQSMIGAGLTDWSGAWPGYNDYNPINNTGLSNAKGNTTFNVSGGNGVVGSYMTYRGIENFFGHMWKWVDGISISSNVPYVTNNQPFTDNTAANYTYLEVTLSNVNGYQNTLTQISRGFLPLTTGAPASTTTKITDYYWQTSGWRVAILGGAADHGAFAGAFYLSVNAASSSAGRYIGARLAF